MSHDVPVVIEKYVLQQSLGKGSFGSVRLAINMFENQRVACKQIKKKGLTRRQIEVLEREIDVLRRISHKNIISFVSVVEDFQWTNIFIEYVPGGDLYNFIQKNTKLSEPRAKELYIQVVEGVQYLHNSRIAHRDLKTENILLTEGNQIKIVDFGLSADFQPSEQLTDHCGTLYYQSPEMIDKRPYVGPEPDIWSLGVILFEMVSGVLPFQTHNFLPNGKVDEETIENRIRMGTYVFPPDFSPSLKQLIQSQLQIQPDLRISPAQILKSEWVTSTDAVIVENPRSGGGGSGGEDFLRGSFKKMFFSKHFRSKLQKSKA
eukprot:TRINITY_DN5404_c0_g1_i1.p1 TRINITY_DN5404_c0_g1~~TRINITY_DN5404_c0_g1_i1.p1  ORF type:complete len:329 (-),score=55.20 TRINITY_DN5404_c0_g1_i1:90-1043(-)